VISRIRAVVSVLCSIRQFTADANDTRRVVRGIVMLVSTPCRTNRTLKKGRRFLAGAYLGLISEYTDQAPQLACSTSSVFPLFGANGIEVFNCCHKVGKVIDDAGR
jgi:hypothetical protein